MGHVASNLALIPSAGYHGKYEWFIFMLEDRWRDDLRSEFSENFMTLSTEVGTENLVVIGSDRKQFYNDAFLHYALYLRGFDSEHFPLPALLISNKHPEEVKVKDGEINANVMIFPIENQYIKPGSISAFLRELCYALKDKEANKALEKLDETEIKKHWGWINKYFDLKPNFMGFGININAILEEATKR